MLDALLSATANSDTTPRCCSPTRAPARRGGSSGIPAARWPPALSHHRHLQARRVSAATATVTATPTLRRGARAQADDDGDHSSRIRCRPYWHSRPLRCICNLPTTLHLPSLHRDTSPASGNDARGLRGARAGRQHLSFARQRLAARGGESSGEHMPLPQAGRAGVAKARIARGCASSAATGALASGGDSSVHKLALLHPRTAGARRRAPCAVGRSREECVL